MARILTVNTGSSSMKATLYGGDGEPSVEIIATAERLGGLDSVLRIESADTSPLALTALPDASHDAVIHALFEWLGQQGSLADIGAVGHRIVHGGPRLHEPCLLDESVRSTLRRLVPLAPDHLPAALSAVDAISRALPAVPQIGCFDTAFHHDMPRVAQLYALPRGLLSSGIRRFGFHGLSYEFIVDELRRIDPQAAAGRLVVAHLGNGASLAAIRDGRAVDTTMGFTPSGGLVMGTRPGDLDPGLLVYLVAEHHMDASALGQLVNQRCGLLGLSETSADMRDLLAAEATDGRAAEAVELFCYQARKYLAAMVAALGGIDTLVFTGGIGQHAPQIRDRICQELGFLGIAIDAERNAVNAPLISSSSTRVPVRVMPTDEDLMIARHTIRLIEAEGVNVV